MNINICQDMLYGAFLRGVNVNGRNMKMTEVCETFRAVGMKDVSSVLATGNIIFHSDEAASKLRGILEAAMNSHFMIESKLFVKTAEEIKTLLFACPYAPNPDWHIYAFVCEPEFERVLDGEFRAAAAGGQTDESAAVNDGYFFWRVRKGCTLDTPFSKILGDRKYKDKFTSRNINTIEKICNKQFVL